MKLFLIPLIIFISIKPFAQQTDKNAVKKTINIMLDAMRKGDSSMLRSAFYKDVDIQGVANKMGGSGTSGSDSRDAFIKAVGTPHKDIWDERIIFDKIKIEGDLAKVWTPYKFYLGNKFNHSGICFYMLTRTPTGWKIFTIIDPTVGK